MRTALLVDYGGVLTTSVLESFGAFCEDEDIDPQALRDVFLSSARGEDSPFHRVEIGALDSPAFDVALAGVLSAACGRTILAEGLKRRLFARTVPDRRMRDAIAKARAAGVRTALVSNSWGLDDYPLDDLRVLFEELVISGEVGLRKPEPDIYRLAAARLGVEPEDCVFVDDFRVNCEGAEAVGMSSVLHRRAEDTIEALGALLGAQLV